MPPPRILGQSATTPGMLDVETADGMRRSIPAWMAPRLGLSADLVAGDAAARELQPAPAPQMAQAPVVEVGDVSVTPARPRQAASDAVAGAQFRGVQDIARGALDAVTGGAASRVTRELGAALTDTGGATDAAAAAAAATDEEAAVVEAATGDVAARQQQTAARYASLEGAAMRGDRQAGYELFRLSQQGDVDAAQALDRARAFQQPAGGGGGPRVTRTETTQLRQQARPTTEAESAELQSAAAEQDRAEREGMVALAREAEAEAGALADTASAMQSAQSQLDALERRRQQAEQARQAELMRRQRALDTAASEVASRSLDPGRMYAKGETRNRTAAAIGLVLGGLADAITGGEAGLTTALGIINTAIDRDIEAQRGNVAIAQQGLAAKQSLLDDMRRTFGDQQAAEEATRATMLEGVERQIQALRLNAASDAQRAALDRMLADIQAQKAAARQAAVMGGIPMTDIVIEQRQQTGGGGGGRRAPLPETPDTGAGAEERERLATARQEAELQVEEVDRALSLIERTSLTGRAGGRVSTMFSDDAEELERVLRRIATPAAIAAFGALGNESQLDIIANNEGMQRTNPRLVDDLRRRRQIALRLAEAAQLGTSSATVREVQTRAPGEREAVTRQRGDLATELGGTRR